MRYRCLAPLLLTVALLLAGPSYAGVLTQNSGSIAHAALNSLEATAAPQSSTATARRFGALYLMPESDGGYHQVAYHARPWYYGAYANTPFYYYRPWYSYYAYRPWYHSFYPYPNAYPRYWYYPRGYRHTANYYYRAPNVFGGTYYW